MEWGGGVPAEQTYHLVIIFKTIFSISVEN